MYIQLLLISRGWDSIEQDLYIFEHNDVLPDLGSWVDGSQDGD